MRIQGKEATPEQARRMGTIFVAVGATLALLFAAAVLVAGSLLGPRGEWPRTPGVVVGSVQRTDVNVDVDRPGSESQTVYQREVEYQVDGRGYTVTTGRERTEPWPAGEQVTVAYDPADPATAELEGETSTTLWIVGGAGVAFGVLFAGIGLAIRASAGRQRGGTSPSAPGGYPVQG